jgi:hypothetical protein
MENLPEICPFHCRRTGPKEVSILALDSQIYGEKIFAIPAARAETEFDRQLNHKLNVFFSTIGTALHIRRSDHIVIWSCYLFDYNLCVHQEVEESKI